METMLTFSFTVVEVDNLEHIYFLSFLIIFLIDYIGI